MTEVNKNIDNRKTKKTEILQKTWAVCALALVCTFLWGSASPCIKLGYALFEIPSGETWTLPSWRIFFLPSFCFSSSFFLREMSPP